MVLTDVPTVEELSETTGQSVDQLWKDREAIGKTSSDSDEV